MSVFLVVFKPVGILLFRHSQRTIIKFNKEIKKNYSYFQQNLFEILFRKWNDSIENEIIFPKACAKNIVFIDFFI